MSVLSIGVTGLNAAQMGLLTTGHNISNASTPGYNRQQIIQSANTPLLTGSGSIGQGTDVTSVTRLYSSFLSNQVMNAQTSAAELGTYVAQIGQIDNMLADSSVGLSPAMQSFFTAVGDAAANPSSTPSRQAMLSAAQGLAARFQSMDQRLGDIRNGVNQQISSEVITINAFVQQLADVNQKIINSQSSSVTQPANDLFDQRDKIISDLNKEIRITTQTGQDGSFSVFFGSGQPLLVGTTVTKLQAVPAPEDLSRMQLAMQDSNGRIINLPETLVNGGNLGGLMQFRAQTLDDAQNGLGRIATVFAASFNTQHMLGQDLTGAMGGAFFNTSQSAQLVLPNPGNLGTSNIDVTLDSPSDLTTSDYRLTMTAINTLTLTRLSDNMTWHGAGATQDLAMAGLMSQLNPPLPGQQEGFSLAFNSPGMNVNDSFLIQPTRKGARDISVAVNDTRAIALAAPVRTAAATTNAGTAQISAGAVSDIAVTLMAPFNITYEASSNSLVGFPVGSTVDVGGLSYPITSATTRVPYSAGTNVSLNGVGVNISGALVNGDTFTIDPAGPTSPGSTSLAALFGAVTTGFAGGGEATATGGLALTFPVTIVAGVNNKFAIAVDGNAPAWVTLPAGSYNAITLPAQLQTSINAALTLPAATTVTVNGANQLEVTSNLAGGATAVTLTPNLGSGTIAAGSITSLSSLPTTPFTLKYSLATDSLSGFPVGAVVTVNGATTTITSATTQLAFTSEATMSFNGISFAISGAPSDGDTFTVGPNPSGVSDNRNAQLLGDLQTKTIISGGTATFQDTYSQIVSQIGNKARELSVSSSAQDTLVQQGQDAIQSVSGVNLDEEAANMLRYQQAYQASAKIITIAGKLFDTLLGI